MTAIFIVTFPIYHIVDSFDIFVIFRDNDLEYMNWAVLTSII